MKNLQNKDKKHIIETYLKVLDLKLKLAQIDFYEYCKLLAYDFYHNKPYLKDLCDLLQAFEENKLLDTNNNPYLKLMVNLPPRHGKTRTLILFCTWMLGRDTSRKIITSAYNDNLAGDFSKYTRNLIQEEKNNDFDIVYNDIFPWAKIKHGDAAMNQWSLEGQFFNYKGSGIGGTITGKGGNYLIIDDFCKNAEEAFNDNHLEKLWLWYTGTWLSRKEKGAKEILCHTPWSKNDIGGRLLRSDGKDEWFVYSKPVIENGKMLCDEILDNEELKRLKRDMDEIIFNANYMMKRLDKKGLLYSRGFQTYTELPVDKDGYICTTRLLAYVDTADTGNDFACCICGEQYKDKIYITGVYYSDENAETTEKGVAETLIKCEIKEAVFESNSGGRYYQRNVEKITKAKKEKINYFWFHQTENKESRIFSNNASVQNDIIFPVNWRHLWPKFYEDIMSYTRKGKNKHDDGPDTLTGLWEIVNSKVKINVSKVSADNLGL